LFLVKLLVFMVLVILFCILLLIKMGRDINRDFKNTGYVVDSPLRKSSKEKFGSRERGIGSSGFTSSFYTVNPKLGSFSMPKNLYNFGTGLPGLPEVDSDYEDEDVVPPLSSKTSFPTISMDMKLAESLFIPKFKGVTKKRGKN